MHPTPSRWPWLRQIAAAGYDLIVCIALLAVSGWVAQGLTQGQLFDAHGQLQHGWFRPLQVTVVASYLLLSWRHGGQTLGLRAWRLRLVARDGSPPTGGRLLRRLAAIGLPWLGLETARLGSPGGSLIAVASLWTLAFAYGLIEPDRRTIQDCLAGTRMQTVAANRRGQT